MNIKGYTMAKTTELDNDFNIIYLIDGVPVSKADFDAEPDDADFLEAVDFLEDDTDTADVDIAGITDLDISGELSREEFAIQEERKAEAQRLAIKEADWRVRLHLGPDSKYLYNADNPGILAPLQTTDGIIFPYTPEIAVQYNANYENYDLTHSNYRGYFYTGSVTQNLIITATFTANDVNEANYMLATLHFLRSATKMFYGKDSVNRGMPPPVVFLTGLGEYQFNNHPCAITMMNYNLPTDVDYIPCGETPGTDPTEIELKASSTSNVDRMRGLGLTTGGTRKKKGAEAARKIKYSDVYTKATYVPTKITINFTMIPIQTRDQVSKEFSLEEYANGTLLKKGFW